MKKVSLGAQLEEIDREIELRRRVYPRLVTKKELRESVANLQMKRIETARATLRWLQANEPRIDAALKSEQDHPNASGGGSAVLVASIEEIDREIELRRVVYPRLVAKREIRESVAALHIERLEAVRATLLWLQDNETRIKEALRHEPGQMDANRDGAAILADGSAAK